jgi:hypothetical protein
MLIKDLSMIAKPCFDIDVRLVVICIFSLMMGACQLTKPNLSYDKCLAGKAPCPEICNGEDDDDDGMVDERLSDACIIFTSLNLERGNEETGFGRAIVSVPDINEDGYDELLVSSSRALSEIDPTEPQEGEVSLIDGASLQITWTVKYGGDFGQALAVGRFDGEQNLWCSGAPTKEGNDGVLGRVLCLNFEGELVDALSAESEYGLGQWLSVRSTVDQDQLLISEPMWHQQASENGEESLNAGRVLITSLVGGEFNSVQTIVGGEANQKIGERVISINDSNEDGINDLLLTGYSSDNSDQRQVWLVSGAESDKLSRIKRFSAPEYTAGVFGNALAMGRYDHTLNQDILAFGAPIVEVDRDDKVERLSRVYFTTGMGDPLGTNSARVFEGETQGIGSSMTTINVGEYDFLVTAGPGLLRIIKLNDSRAEVVKEFELPRGAIPVLAATNDLDVDGEIKLWVGLPELSSVRLITVRPAMTDPN